MADIFATLLSHLGEPALVAIVMFALFIFGIGYAWIRTGGFGRNRAAKSNPIIDEIQKMSLRFDEMRRDEVERELLAKALTSISDGQVKVGDNMTQMVRVLDRLDERSQRGEAALDYLIRIQRVANIAEVAVWPEAERRRSKKTTRRDAPPQRAPNRRGSSRD